MKDVEVKGGVAAAKVEGGRGGLMGGRVEKAGRERRNAATSRGRSHRSQTVNGVW